MRVKLAYFLRRVASRLDPYSRQIKKANYSALGLPSDLSASAIANLAAFDQATARYKDL